MSIYSNDNIRKIVKSTPRELPHLVQNRENNYAKIMPYTVYDLAIAIVLLCVYLPYAWMSSGGIILKLTQTQLPWW